MPVPELRQVSYAHVDAQRLIAEVQQEYVRRYGGPDDTPVDDDHFSPPNGTFVVLYEDGVPVATGGWRLCRGPAGTVGSDGTPGTTAELKRMYVVPTSRGRGHARLLLAHLEDTAATAGADWLVLETGLRQPEAIALYTAAGYSAVEPFGHYAQEPGSVHLGKRLRLSADPRPASPADIASSVTLSAAPDGG